jgi:hypothetical protein
LLATVYHGLGIDPASTLPSASGTGPTALVDARPIVEAFA